MWRPTFTLFRKIIIPSLIENAKIAKFYYSTKGRLPKSTAQITLIGASVGVLVGAGWGGYTHYKINAKKQVAPVENEEYPFLKEAPSYRAQYKVSKELDTSNLHLVLFQYRTCPFCCKVRAYLDARGISYEVVEVDAVLRQAIKWSGYKKVPILLAKVDGGYQQLMDSSAIMSILETFLRDKSFQLWDVTKFYPVTKFVNDQGKEVTDITNKYFIMHNAAVPDKTERTAEAIDFVNLPPILFDGIQIAYSKTVKNLGVIMDRTLSWVPQVSEVSKKVFAAVVSLRRFRNFLPAVTKIALAQTLLLPLLDYADVSYLDLFEEQLNKLERLQNVCIRFIFGLLENYILISASKKEEREWRQWADRVLVHTLSPNVYRTAVEALDTFKWFEEAGRWRESFPAWECALMVYGGAAAMWIIAKRLKTRHNIKDDVRQSLYDAANDWVAAVRKKGTKFLGGGQPNLADIAVYGVLSSIEGCQAFQDLRSHTDIGVWYDDIKSSIERRQGKVITLHTQA